MPKPKWESDFDKKFDAVKETSVHYYNPWLSEVKSFIRTQLEGVIEEIPDGWREFAPGQRDPFAVINMKPLKQGLRKEWLGESKN